MFDQQDQVSHSAITRAEAERMFRRTLAAWVVDCARLRRSGLDRPSRRGIEAAGPAWAGDSPAAPSRAVRGD